MNTIYDGTYVIGQTSATNYVAGPGISITKPSEGTVRIGTDETILWEGSAAASDFPLTLSESPTNFESLEFHWSPRYQGDYGCPTVVARLDTDGHGGIMKYSLGALYWNANNTYYGEWFMAPENNVPSSIKIVSEKNSFTNLSQAGAPTDGLNCRMWKIVGINRKEV